MEIVKCDRGHFYDAEKFKECPFCSSASGYGNYDDPFASGYSGEDDKTIAQFQNKGLDDEHTIALNSGMGNGKMSSGVAGEDVTIGIFSSFKGQSLVTGWLVCVEGVERGRDYRIGSGWNWVGRAYSNNISIRDDMDVADQKHCAVVYDNKSNRFFLADGGHALAYINGELLNDSCALKSGDIIEIGNSKFEFVPFCREGRTWN